MPSYFPGLPIAFLTLAGKDWYLDNAGFEAHEKFFKLLRGEQTLARYYDNRSIAAVIRKHTQAYLEADSNDKSARAVVDDLLNELAIAPDGVDVHFLVNGLKLLDVPSFGFGRATFTTIDQAYAERLFPGRSQDPEDVAALQRRRSDIMGQTGIEVLVRGDVWRSRQEAYREAQITLGALAVYCTIFLFESSTPRLFRFTLSGMGRQDFGQVISFNARTQARAFTIGGLISVPALQLNLVDVERFRAYAWDDVSTFLRERSDTSEIDRAIETSLFWIGEAVGEKLLASMMSKYFTAIETLVIGRRRSDTIVQDVARRLPILLTADNDDKEKMRRNLLRTGGLYDLRSQVAYAGLSEIEDMTRLFATGTLAAWAVLRCLRARGLNSLDQAIRLLDIAPPVENAVGNTVWRRRAGSILSLSALRAKILSLLRHRN
ncbi:MAG: hypothetical protein ACREX3_09805 [Gammaproteobacteria bacterium]